MNPLSPAAVSGKLLNWYEKNHRDLPWRNTRDPYIIWLSEIILQQTRVEQGLPYFRRFIERFPKIQDLAKASENEVLKFWQGLGYYTRARNLHTTAKFITSEYKGKFPDEYNNIRKLKGVGDYTAAAIASFAYNYPAAVVDGNVHRFLARLFGEFTPAKSSSGKKLFNELAESLLNREKPAIHNQAIMEFGALHCRPVNPECATCPFQNSCIAYRSDQVALLPVKSKTTLIKTRYFNYLLVHFDGKIFLNKRAPGDIWTQLYEPPLIETGKKISVDKLIHSNPWNEYFQSGFEVKSDKHFAVHKLSHQHIYARLIEIILTKKPKKLFVNSFISVVPEEIYKYPVSRLVENMLRVSLKELYEAAAS